MTDNKFFRTKEQKERRMKDRKRAKASPIWSENTTDDEIEKIKNNKLNSNYEEDLVASFFIGNEHYTDNYIPTNTNDRASNLAGTYNHKKNIQYNSQSKYFQKPNSINVDALIERENLLNRKSYRDEEYLDDVMPPIEENYDTSIGPRPKEKIVSDPKEDRKQFAGQPLAVRKELELYSKYVKEGKRIPRRGEVGMTEGQIKDFEKIGYVMSGSRHMNMNNVRMKREIAVYNAEEKRALNIYQIGQKEKKEENIINGLRGMWEQTKSDYHRHQEEEYRRNKDNNIDSE